MDNTKPWVTGAAFAVVIAAVYVACAMAVLLFPDGALSFFNTWAHGIDVSVIKRPAADALTAGDWAIGFVTAVIAGFLAGTLYAWARNAFARLSANAA